MKVIIHWDNGDTFSIPGISDEQVLIKLRSIIATKNDVCRSFTIGGKHYYMNGDKIRMVEEIEEKS